jgi:putative ABC transport system substrate-binding protein
MDTSRGYPPALFHEPQLRGVEIFVVDLRGPEELGAACATVLTLRAEAILVAQGLNWEFQSSLVEAITRLRLPAVFPGREYVELGGVLSFGYDVNWYFQRIATQIDKLLRGAKPADLPVEQGAAFDLAINLKTAKTLGITIPRELLVRADWIVQ